MLNITWEACQCLWSRLDRMTAADDVAMRFVKRKNGWRLRLGQERPGDTTFTHEGRNILLMDAEAMQAMAALILDVTGPPATARLKLTRNAPSSG